MRPLIGTSSKMNLTASEAAAYFDALRPALADITDRTLFVIPPFTALWVARERLAGSNIAWGAQDVHPEDSGAHTGDISAPMLADLGCTYVEVGHHERRRDHGETDELVATKVAAVQRWGMTAVVCVGEQRRLPADAVVETLETQLRAVREADPERVVIAYEPAWAIGIGAEAAPASWVAEAHAAIRAALVRSVAGGQSMPIIYGGSVSADRAGALLATSGVDGLFVGRMALDPTVFAAIAHANAG